MVPILIPYLVGLEAKIWTIQMEKGKEKKKKENSPIGCWYFPPFSIAGVVLSCHWLRSPTISFVFLLLVIFPLFRPPCISTLTFTNSGSPYLVSSLPLSPFYPCSKSQALSFVPWILYPLSQHLPSETSFDNDGFEGQGRDIKVKELCENCRQQKKKKMRKTRSKGVVLLRFKKY